MTLKPQLDKAHVAASSPIVWGVMTESGEPANVIRFECDDGAYSYPYHALARWVWQAGNPETLVIRAGTDRVTVCGSELQPVRDAVDSGRLRVLRPTNERLAYLKSDTVVTQIMVESAAGD